MNVIVVGCGRVGARIAMSMDQSGHNVCVVEIDSKATRRLSNEYRGNVVIGTGIDEDILRSAGIEEADVFFAVTNGDNTNIMCAQIAHRVFEVERVVARIYDPVREETYRRMGIDTVCPTTTISSLMISAAQGGS